MSIHIRDNYIWLGDTFEEFKVSSNYLEIIIGKQRGFSKDTLKVLDSTEIIWWSDLTNNLKITGFGTIYIENYCRQINLEIGSGTRVCLKNFEQTERIKLRRLGRIRSLFQSDMGMKNEAYKKLKINEWNWVYGNNSQGYKTYSEEEWVIKDIIE